MWEPGRLRQVFGSNPNITHQMLQAHTLTVRLAQMLNCRSSSTGTTPQLNTAPPAQPWHGTVVARKTRQSTPATTWVATDRDLLADQHDPLLIIWRARTTRAEPGCPDAAGRIPGRDLSHSTPLQTVWTVPPFSGRCPWLNHNDQVRNRNAPESWGKQKGRSGTEGPRHPGKEGGTWKSAGGQGRGARR
jgi:hypothetical protein